MKGLNASNIETANDVNRCSLQKREKNLKIFMYEMIIEISANLIRFLKLNEM